MFHVKHNVSSKRENKDLGGVKDFSVSGKLFDLKYNEEYEMYFTFPKPTEFELPNYYESSEYISHTDASSSFTDKLYQMVKQFMLSQKLNFIEKKNIKSSILDLGAGTGDFLQKAQKRGWQIKGVEPNQGAIILARKKNIELVEHINKISGLYDVITMWHVLEHVYELDTYLKFLKKSLAPQGKLYVAVPNFNSYDATQYQEYWAAYDVPRHLYHFSQNAIRTIFREAEFKVIETKPLVFDSFYVSLLSEKYKYSKINYLRGFWEGLRSNISAWRTGEFSSLIYVIEHAKN